MKKNPCVFPSTRYIKNMNNTNTTNATNIEDTDRLHALRVSAGNLAICLDEEDESLDGRYELFSEYEK